MSAVRRALLTGRGGVFRTRAPGEQVLRLASDLGWRTYRLDTAGTGDKDALMDLLARVLDLPEWFGRNWDALADCLADLDARPGSLVLWEHAQTLPAPLREDLAELLAERAGQDDPAPFVVVHRAGADRPAGPTGWV